jgi:hypothetical protein
MFEKADDLTSFPDSVNNNPATNVQCHPVANAGW